MKILLLIMSLFLLTACQPEETQQKSSQAGIQSLDTSKVIVLESNLYIVQGMVQTELLALIEPLDQSRQTYRFLTNDGQVKTRAELFEYEKLEVTSEDGFFKRTYTIYYLAGE